MGLKSIKFRLKRIMLDIFKVLIPAKGYPLNKSLEIKSLNIVVDNKLFYESKKWQILLDLKKWWKKLGMQLKNTPLSVYSEQWDRSSVVDQ